MSPQSCLPANERENSIGTVEVGSMDHVIIFDPSHCRTITGSLSLTVHLSRHAFPPNIASSRPAILGGTTYLQKCVAKVKTYHLV